MLYFEFRSKRLHLIFSVRLSCYRVHRYCARVLRPGASAVCAFLVGDALFAVPFFRALNNGIQCGTRLARTVVNCLEGNSPSLLSVPLASIGQESELLSEHSAPTVSPWLRPFQFSKAVSAASSLHSSHVVSAALSGEYVQFVESLIKVEWETARAKNSGAELIKLAARLNSAVPWQLNAWGGAEREYILKHSAFDDADNG